jgi:hypothetical protein
MPDIQAQAPDGSVHVFPNGTDPAIIDRTMKDYITGAKSSDVTVVSPGGQKLTVDKNAPAPKQPQAQAAAPQSTLSQLGHALITPILNAPKDTPLSRYAELEQNFGDPIHAGVAQFFAGTTNDIGKFAASSTSPAGVSMLAAGGGLPSALIGAGYGVYGAKQALEGFTPKEGETQADAVQRVLTGSAMAVGGVAMGAETTRAALGRHFAKVYGLSPEYANDVAEQVKEINATQAEGQQKLTDAQSRLKLLKQNKLETGRQILADAAQAVYQEQARVQEPFAKIAAQMTDPVSDAASIHGIIEGAANRYGVKPDEIPSAALRALPSEAEATGARSLTNNELQMVQAINKTPQWQNMSAVDIRNALPNLGYAPKQIDAILSVARPEEATPATGDVSFGDLTRIREDLYGAAQSSKDSAVKAALSEAQDKVTDLQEQAAAKAGLGKEYQAAKADYLKFKRGAGSGLMNNLLNARDAEDQAIAPKIAQFTNPSTAEALRTVLKPLGIDVSPLDSIIGDIGATKAEVKSIPKETAAAVKGLQQKGRIVPGQNVEQLAGMSNEQINQARIESIIKGSRARGIPNPGGLVMLIYGTLTGRPFPAMYGAARLTLPELVKSPMFQQMAIEQSGIRPGSTQAAALGVGLATLGSALAMQPQAQPQAQPQEAAPTGASIAEMLRSKGITLPGATPNAPALPFRPGVGISR